jgi:hypothetical protein
MVYSVWCIYYYYHRYYYRSYYHCAGVGLLAEAMEASVTCVLELLDLSDNSLGDQGLASLSQV